MEFFSQEFVDIVTRMLAFDPLHRLTLQQVMDHAWMKGPMPTTAEVLTDFKNRK
jgi:serine/threonine protein kinase